jgi:hypothetical protein
MNNSFGWVDTPPRAPFCRTRDTSGGLPLFAHCRLRRFSLRYGDRAGGLTKPATAKSTGKWGTRALNSSIRVLLPVIVGWGFVSIAARVVWKASASEALREIGIEPPSPRWANSLQSTLAALDENRSRLPNGGRTLYRFGVGDGNACFQGGLACRAAGRWRVLRAK